MIIDRLGFYESRVQPDLRSPSDVFIADSLQTHRPLGQFMLRVTHLKILRYKR
jgi:hypothetical protein